LKFRRTLIIGVIVAAFFFVAPKARARVAARKPKPPVTLEVVFHVADMDGRPVADASYLDPRLERANEIFGPLGVVFSRKELRPLAPEHATIDDARAATCWAARSAAASSIASWCAPSATWATPTSCGAACTGTRARTGARTS